MSGVVIDTNILVAVFLAGRWETDEVLEKAQGGLGKIIYSRWQIREFVKVLGYERIMKKYKVDASEVERFLNWFQGIGKEVVEKRVNLCRDPGDDMVLGMAVAAAGKRNVVLVTRDKDILALKGKVEGVEIVTPGEFLKREQVSN